MSEKIKILLHVITARPQPIFDRVHCTNHTKNPQKAQRRENEIRTGAHEAQAKNHESGKGYSSDENERRNNDKRRGAKITW